MKSHWRLFMVAMELVMLFAISGVAEAASKSGEALHTVSSPNQGEFTALNGVAAISSNDVWAVGSLNNATLVEHWDGSSWSVVPSPSPGKPLNYLGGVAVVSTADIWAVGSASISSQTSETLVEHWDGSSWSVVPSPSPCVGKTQSFNYLYGVTAISTTNVWAVGACSANPPTSRPLVEHWNGSSWSVIKSPSPASISYLTGVTVVSATDIWAVGSSSSDGGSTYQTLVERWNGRRWKVVSSPSPGSSFNFLGGVTAVSKKNIWAVGAASNSIGTSQTLIEHWNGKSWSIVASPNGGASNPLSAVESVSATDIWAVGDASNSTGISQTLIENWNGKSWSIVASPSPGSLSNSLSGIAVVSATDIWTVGNYSNEGSSTYQTLAEHWDGSSWSVVPSP